MELVTLAGYLNVISSEFHDEQLVAKISIPNKEVSFVYYKIVKQWFSEAISLSSYDIVCAKPSICRYG
ncbi:MAG: hypothetical protein MRQ09_06150 [Candidatus Midichloria sp.]|nr:hypothetical protein [Candidatus Midichloria sp.]